MNIITLKLPYPPSVNTYWRHPTTGKLAGRHLISEAGRKFRADVLSTVSLSQRREALAGSLAIQVDVYPPDRRRRDLDNLLKGLLDALTHARVIEDDSCFDRILICRREVIPAGQVILQITPMEKNA